MIIQGFLGEESSKPVSHTGSYFLILVGRKVTGIQGATSSTKGLSFLLPGRGSYSYPPCWKMGFTTTKAFSTLELYLVDWPGTALLG